MPLGQIPQEMGGAMTNEPEQDDRRSHTPPPWHWEYHPDTGKPIALVSRDRDVLLATGDDRTSWAEVSEADRLLIAMSPELLGVCVCVHKYAVEQAKAGRAFPSDLMQRLFQAIQVARIES